MDGINLIQAQIDAGEEGLKALEGNGSKKVKTTNFGKVEFGSPQSDLKGATFADILKDHKGEPSFKNLLPKVNKFCKVHAEEHGLKQ